MDAVEAEEMGVGLDGPRSLIATTSMSLRFDSMIARRTLRPMRPKPLIATLIVISNLSFAEPRRWRAIHAGNSAKAWPNASEKP